MPLNRPTVLAFLMLISVDPGKALSVLRKATRLPEGSVTAMLEGRLAEDASAAAAEMIALACCESITWR